MSLQSLLVNVVPRVSWKRAVLFVSLSLSFFLVFHPSASLLGSRTSQELASNASHTDNTLVRSARARKSRDALTDITGEPGVRENGGERVRETLATGEGEAAGLARIKSLQP